MNTGTISTPVFPGARKYSSFGRGGEAVPVPPSSNFPAMDTLIARVAGFIEERKLLGRNQRFIAAVSGGVDSMTLLHILDALRARSGWEIIIAHFNHGLRGRESDRDERFVQRAAKSLGLSCETGRGDLRARRDADKDSTEMACRNARHEFLAQLARRRGIDTVALAHQASDQAELFLMRLFRGAGGSGLSGMSEKDPSPKDAGITLIRPLLEFGGSEIREFAERNQIAFREDASNLSRGPERNRARHEALPFLEKTFERCVERGVLQSMRIIESETAYVEGAASDWLMAKRRKRFDSLHPALQRQLLYLQLLEQRIEPRFDWIESLREKRDAWISINSSVEISRDEVGAIRTRDTKRAQFEDACQEVCLASASGSVEFEGMSIRWRRFRNRPVSLSKTNRSQREIFDADRVGKTVTLRHWRPGDRFQPIGMNVAIKLQDWFTNLKIPRARRRKLILAVSESGQIFWIEGCRIGEKFKLTDSPKRQLAWEWCPSPESGGTQ